MQRVTDMATSRAQQEVAEAASLRALVAEQLAQITDLTRRLAEAEALHEASADPHLLRASMEALDRRLQDSREIGLGREAALAAQILADGAALTGLRAERDAAVAGQDEQRQTADRETADRRQRIAALEGELHAADEENKILRQDLDRIYASHSWKLTEPLRAGRRLLGGG